MRASPQGRSEERFCRLNESACRNSDKGECAQAGASGLALAIPSDGEDQGISPAQSEEVRQNAERVHVTSLNRSRARRHDHYRGTLPKPQRKAQQAVPPFAGPDERYVGRTGNARAFRAASPQSKPSTSR